MERNDLIARKLFIPAAARWRRTAGPGHACQRQGKEKKKNPEVGVCE